ncbi:MAG: sensor histidine kinase [Janthinobacterium lividum]
MDKKAKIIFEDVKNYYLNLDKEKTIQVVSNLLMNSLRWTAPDKPIIVELRDVSLSGSSLYGVQCSIKDQDLGIPEDELEFIFEPFAESSRTASKACGKGLGLAICKEIIRIHGGEIWAISNARGGASINFIIPYNLAG